MQAHIVDNTQVETPSDLIKQHTDRFHGQENETRLLGLVNPLAWASPVMDLDTAEEKATELGKMAGVRSIRTLKEYHRPDDKVMWTGNSGRAYQKSRKRDSQDGGRDHDAFTPHLMTQVDMHREAGYTGKGFKIAVIDTGIDFKHPALGGCFGKGCLVSYGHDYVDGDNVEEPTMDCDGHGTHVAGTIAAQSNPLGFTGVAPDVTLGSYKVFGCNGTAPGDTIAAAFAQAFEDGSDIISASLGGDQGWSQEEGSVIVQRIVEQGVPCVIATGNSGASGLFFASGPADGIGSTAVASFDNVVIPQLLTESTYSIDDDGEVTFGWHEGAPAAWADVELPLYATSLDAEVFDDACDPLPSDTPDLSNRIVLIRRGTCTYDEKAANAADKGAKYIIFYNNVPGIEDVSSAHAQILAVAMTTAEEGEYWLQALAAGSKALPAPFTSWGPTWETELKPQFAAPGGHILSLWPRALGSYAVLGGTSMATPLVSGVLALLAEIRGRLDPVELTNILAATAKPHFFNDGNQAFNQLAPVPQQGAGLIQSYEAAFTTTIFSVSSLAFNDTEHLRSLSFSIKNVGDADVTYTLDHRPAAMAYTFAAGTGRANTFPNELTDDYATLYFSKPIITVKAEREEKVTVSLDLPEDVDNAGLPVYSGYIALYGDDGKVLHLPYMGIAGSMRETPVLASANGFVYEAQTPTRSIVNASFVLPAQGTADPTTDTLPGVNLEFILGTSVAYLEVIPVGSHDEGLTYEFLDVRTMGSAVPALRWITRQTDVVLTWDGQLDSEKYAPAGRYKFHVKVLRVFGDAEDPDDYDTIETAAFSIRYEASSG
ncbi:Minor extracellular protease vpr like protein [Verticillium longisporum]|nr:Minor extracellular protease vpr like protein [Verticillium longisporum]